MQSHPGTDLAADRAIASAPAASTAESSPPDLAELLARAAAMAAEQGSGLDEFMEAAWSAFVDTQPGLREHLEEMRLMAQLEQLRQNGRVPMA